MKSHETHRTRLSISTFPQKRHICAFFYSKNEEYQVLLPFVEEGLSAGERAFHIVDPAHRARHLDRLTEEGLDVAALSKSGHLEVRTWDEAYLRGNRFDQEAMLALVQEVLGGPVARRFPRTRLIANMEWALLDLPGVDDLVEYETRLNYILPRFNDPVI